jgi:hypothetical protein
MLKHTVKIQSVNVSFIVIGVQIKILIGFLAGGHRKKKYWRHCK